MSSRRRWVASPRASSRIHLTHSSSQRHEYGERLRGFLGMLREAYPTKKVAFLLMHPFRANDLDAKFFCEYTLPFVLPLRGTGLCF